MKLLRDFDNCGFVSFPQSISVINPVDCGKTSIYLVAFQEGISSLQLEKTGNFCGDDIVSRQNRISLHSKIDDIVKDAQISEELEDLEDFYFKDGNIFPVISSVLIGWSKFSWIYTDRLNPWCASFRDLSTEGRKLYYSFKKLHNNSDIRLLTFNNIK
jgi:hypothetical protein